MAQAKPLVSNRWLIVILIAFNSIAIGLSEIQRRALNERSVEVHRELVAKFDRRVAEVEARVLQALAAKLEGVETRVTNLNVALSILNGAKLDVSQKLDDPILRDALRVFHTILLRNALESYRKDHKSFPALADNPVDDLRSALVMGKYLTAIPHDPSGRSYRYTTDGAGEGQRYGLRINREIGGDCLTGVGAEKSGWWGTLPVCPF